MLEKLFKKQKKEPQETKQELIEELEAIQEQPVTRMVRLKYKSCCGCGCDYVDLEREVPFDSELEDGDIVDEVEDNDIWL